MLTLLYKALGSMGSGSVRNPLSLCCIMAIEAMQYAPDETSQI